MSNDPDIIRAREHDAIRRAAEEEAEALTRKLAAKMEGEGVTVDKKRQAEKRREFEELFRRRLDFYLMGIDPGMSGGYAVLNPRGEVIELKKMPEGYGLIDTLRRHNKEKNLVVVCEAIHSRSEDVRYFNRISVLLKHFGGIQWTCQCLDIPAIYVQPRTWLDRYGLKKNSTDTKTSWKNRLKSRAIALYPDQKITLATADALLIARYGFAYHLQKLQKEKLPPKYFNPAIRRI